VKAATSKTPNQRGETADSNASPDMHLKSSFQTAKSRLDGGTTDSNMSPIKKLATKLNEKSPLNRPVSS